MENEKAINVIRKVRQMEEEHFRKAGFCREHNMELDKLKHEAIETALRKVSGILQDEFDTGYVSFEE